MDYTLNTLNFDDFYKDSALGLLHLAGTFPNKTDLYVSDIVGPDETDEYGLHSPRYLSALSALIWLIEEGFIRCDSVHKQENLEQAVISHSTFLKLWNSAPKEVIDRIDDLTEVKRQEELENTQRLGNDYSYLYIIHSAIKSSNSNLLAQVMLNFYAEA